MQTEFELWLCKDSGEKLALIENLISMSYVKTVNGVGAFDLKMGNTIPQDFFRRDRQIQFWRRTNHGALALDFLGFLNKWRFVSDANGLETVTLTGDDQNVLLKRRIVAEKAGTTYAMDNGLIDDIMKGIVDASMGSVAGGSRDIEFYGFSIEPDRGEGSQLEKRFAWRNVLELLQELNETSMVITPEIFFGVYVNTIAETSQVQLQFRTIPNQPGVNKVGENTGAFKPFSVELGTFVEPYLEYDYSNEINYLYAGGPGEGADRTLVEISDDESIALSWLGRSEGFYNASGADDTTDAIYDQSAGELLSNRPRIRFGGSITNVRGSEYGKDWDLGDRVPILVFGRELSGVIRQIRVDYSSTGNETIQAQVEGEYALV